MTTLYTLEAVQNLLDRYHEKGGQVITTHEGTLLDDYIAHGEGLKTTVITARYLNAWSSAYTIRKYNKTPKKYRDIIEANS